MNLPQAIMAGKVKPSLEEEKRVYDETLAMETEREVWLKLPVSQLLLHELERMEQGLVDIITASSSVFTNETLRCRCGELKQLRYTIKLMKGEIK